jgi:hypothetical protein
MKREDVDKGRPLAIDPDAVSADPSRPAFIARPPGAPVYYGFPILADVCVDGFCFGTITDFEREPSIYGDAYVVAPDGSRAGLVWEVAPEVYVTVIREPEPDRWGVWAVGFPASYPEPMSTREQARQNLAAILPRLRLEWERWRTTH